MSRATMLFLILTAVCATAANAQNTAVQIGAGGGLAITTITGDDVEDAKNRNTPFFGGVLVIQKPGSRLGLETGLLQVPKGANTSIPGEAGLELAYLEVPLLVRYSFGPPEAKVAPFLQLGGSMGIKSSCKVTAESVGSSQKIDCDDPQLLGLLEFKSLDLGIGGGAGVDISMGDRWVLSPSVRYTRGLSRLADGVGGDGENPDVRNSAFQVGVILRVRM